jgi:hypothetical protein
MKTFEAFSVDDFGASLHIYSKESSGIIGSEISSVNKSKSLLFLGVNDERGLKQEFLE